MSITYLTLQDFADKYPWLSVATLRRMIADKQIDYLQPRGKGGLILIPDDALDRLVIRASSDTEMYDDLVDGEYKVKQQTRGRSGPLPNWKRNR